VGPPGSFQVSVDGEVVAEKKLWGFPSEEEIVAAVSKVASAKQPAGRHS
jgi:hypothetical protein